MAFPGNQHIESFRTKVLDYYRNYGRPMPWREDLSPFSIFISEVMLQQTQVSRVENYYFHFMREYGSFCAVADLPLEQLLDSWSGLGYNRRARFLRQACEIICSDYDGVLPSDPEMLVKLPGIGKNTAGSICAFAFNLPVVFIETNIRRVFIHEFFPGEDKVSDSLLLPLIEQCLPADKSRIWYWALMDYGVELKRQGILSNRKSLHYSRQSKFEGSRRQLRAEVLRQLRGSEGMQKTALQTALGSALPDHGFDEAMLDEVLAALQGEGFLVAESNGSYRIGD